MGLFVRIGGLFGCRVEAGTVDNSFLYAPLLTYLIVWTGCRISNIIL